MVDRNLHLAASLSRPVLRAHLGVSVLFSKNMVESFIAANPDYLEPNNGVAVIAKIAAIQDVERTEKEPEQSAGKVGMGNGLELLCLRNR